MSAPIIFTVPVRVVVLYVDDEGESLPGWYWAFVSRHHGGDQAHGPFETRDKAIDDVSRRGDALPFTERGEDDAH